MDMKAAGIIGACIIAAALVIAVVSRSGTQSFAPGIGDNGRYQVASTDTNVFVVDTRTGRLWHRLSGSKSGAGQWLEEKTPWRGKGGK